MEKIIDVFGMLACPRSGRPLEKVVLNNSEVAEIRKIDRKQKGFEYSYDESHEFLSDDQGSYYSIVDEFPILMYPEKFVRSDNEEVANLMDYQYQEAYEEMVHYNSLGAESVESLDDKSLSALMGSIRSHPDRPNLFPDPETYWLDARHDALSQYEAYKYLAPIKDKRFLQLGGSGSHAVKALLAGACYAMHLTPMIGEAKAGRELAKYYGVEDRFFAVIAIGEELPFIDNSFDVIYSGGCVHHMRTEFAFREFHRVLSSEGRFSCVDPWKTPIHGIGTRIFGKREANVFCRPINPERLKYISIFEDRIVRQHGALWY